MDRAAGRCLELCCDDEVVRGLPEEARWRYGAVLLETAGNVRPLAFSTCFAGGKEQMKERLANLFARKRNSMALVCVVLAAVLLAGGLVACESAGGAETGALPQEAGNEDRRALFRRYFEENYEANTAGVILADVTGDGQDEMLVLTMYGTGGEALSLRDTVEADRFGWGRWEICGVREGEVVPLDSLRDIGGGHVGWGQQYLVPRETGFAVLEYDPYEGQGLAGYGYRLSRLTEEGEWVELDSGRVSFSLMEEGSPTAQGMEFSTDEEIALFLSKVWAYRDSGVPLLCYDEGSEGRGFSYLYLGTESVFTGMAGVHSGAGVVSSGGQGAQDPQDPAPEPTQGQMSLPEAPPEVVAQWYLEAIARKLFLYEGGSGLEYTAYWGGASPAASYIPPRSYELPDGRVCYQEEVQSRLRYMDDAANCLKYRRMADEIWHEDMSIGCTVERVDVGGDYAVVELYQAISFRYRELTERSGLGIGYRVGLALCDGTWLVTDVDHDGNTLEWCDSKDEESFLALTGLPHGLDWFSNAINDDRTRPEWAQFLTGEDLSRLPVSCVAGWPDPDSQAESGEIRVKLLYSPVAADGYQVTVRLEADGTLTLLDAEKFPLGAG